MCNYYDNGASNIAVVVSFFEPCCGPWCKKCGILNVAFYMMSVLALELISYKRNAMCMAALCCNGFGVPARHLSVLCWQSVSKKFFILFKRLCTIAFFTFFGLQPEAAAESARCHSFPLSGRFHFATARFCSSWIPSIARLTSSGAELMDPFICRRHSARRDSSHSTLQISACWLAAPTIGAQLSASHDFWL